MGKYTGEPVLFYEGPFYSFSLFSSFRVVYRNIDFDTGEHAFQMQKFVDFDNRIAGLVLCARSAHDAKKIALEHKAKRDPLWDSKKVRIFRDIQLCRVDQHEVIRSTLLSTEGRRLIENSPDPFWGWGTDRRGLNHGGVCTEEVRDRLLRAQ